MTTDHFSFPIPCLAFGHPKPKTQNPKPRVVRGQVSTELLMIIGFVVLLFIPLVLFVYYKTSELNIGIEGLESRLLSSKLAFISNSLGSLGDGNSLKVEFTLPAHVRTLEFRSIGEGGEVMITLVDGSQLSQVTSFPFNSSRIYMGGTAYKLEFLSQNRMISVMQSS